MGFIRKITFLALFSRACWPYQLHQGVLVSGSACSEFCDGLYQLVTTGGYYQRISTASWWYIYKYKAGWALHYYVNSSYPWITSLSEELVGRWSREVEVTPYTVTLPTQGDTVRLDCEYAWCGVYTGLDRVVHNGQTVYAKYDNTTFMYMSIYGVWMSGNYSLVDAGEQVVSFGTWAEWTLTENDTFRISYDFNPTSEFFNPAIGARKCVLADGMPSSPINICDKIKQCRKGGDEIDCPFFVNLRVWVPLAFTFAFVGMGFIIWLGLEYLCSFSMSQNQCDIEKDKEPQTQSTCNVVDEVLNKILVNKTQEVFNDEIEIEVTNMFNIIHNTPGALKLLIETGFTLLSDPFQRHRLSQWIYEDQIQRYGEDENDILRSFRDLCSNKSVQDLMECRDPPGFLKRLKLNLSSINELVFSHGIMSSIAPLLRVYMFLLDYVKDFFLLIFVCYRIRYLDQETYWMIHFTAKAHGTSIALAASVIGIYLLYIDHFNVAKIPSKYSRIVTRVLLFVLSPITPVIIILQAVKLQVMQKTMITKWRSNNEKVGNKKVQPSKICLKLKELEYQNHKVLKMFNDLKLIEMNIETIPQIVCIVVYGTYSSYMKDTLIKDIQNLQLDSESFYFIMSFLLSFYTTINSLLVATNFLKRGQIGLKQKLILFPCYMLQIAPRVFALVGMILLPMWLTNKNSSYEYADIKIPNSVIGLLVFLHLPIHWLLHLIYYQNCSSIYQTLSYPDRILHILCNTWVSLPLRNTVKEEDQKSKGPETAINLIISWLYTSATCLLVGLIIPDKRWIHYRFLFILHPLAGVFLGIYYNCCHTWRHTLTWRRKVENIWRKQKKNNLCKMNIFAMDGVYRVKPFDE